MLDQTEPTEKQIRFLTVDEVLSKRRVSRAKLNRDISLGRFPQPVKDGKRALFVEREVDAWMASIAAQRPAFATTIAEAA